MKNIQDLNLFIEDNNFNKNKENSIPTVPIIFNLKKRFFISFPFEMQVRLQHFPFLLFCLFLPAENFIFR